MSSRQHLHAASQDPTRTKSIRRAYSRKLRGAFGRINSALREGIVEDDIFGYHDNGELFAADKPPDLSTVPDDVALERFREWLEDAQESEVMEVIERDNNTYIERAYERGLKDADIELNRAGFDVPDTEAAALLRQPVHQRKLQILFSRNYAELEGITSEVSRQVTRELSDGIGQGLNPTETARNITDRVDSIGKTRSEVMARTETIHAHAESTLTRYEEMGVSEVQAQPEVVLNTAGDQRVCSECADLAGTTYTTEDARGVIPVHPRCRCSWSVARN